MIIQPATDFKEVAEMMAQINALADHHIGYCGTAPEEIYSVLQEDFQLEEIYLAYHQGEIVGILAFDYDVETKCAEVWGPFICDENWLDIANRLWQEHPLTKKNWDFEFFINKKNRQLIGFITEHLNGSYDGNYYVLKKMRKEHQPIQRKGKDIELHNQNEKAEFIQLHEQTFKQAYYSGAGILERLNETNRLFIYKSDSHVVGYVYLEGTPAFREGTIEFIGVDKLHRNKGIGRQLLQEALDFLFGELKVNELSLVVSEDKKDAFHLYRSIGFSVRYELVSYELKKQINS
ncbi:hypothetical protein AJ85_19890 [Alkalihalobacillus alcalophilus ATCC 27647 = CGMCC 1.3604]|uniref:N-acetyltransferase domain-containing protein n=2 Tax=Alkalihalobacillus alcalophilus TaxID=1445 RepID=A0A4S4JXH1_ALKAL|nr:N-acetyltransferase [Alkalihalobacillus alcalophilus]MED1562391.1 N-acetyltransferase [Alkalihalobacillus alcalophilus]THG89047.1 hypothetical protein AJ85_19890 [Alkalihalobacillus alcalophilus ATCC 27647 = CGMCC 1.3604]